MAQLVIGIPGRWQDKRALIAAVVSANADPTSPRFMAIGGIIMDMTVKQPYGFEVYEHDPGLARAFEIAGQGRISDDDLSAIGEHTFTVYLVIGEPFATPDLANLDAARSLLSLGTHLLVAGGLAVKVEHSGVAHSADRWRYYAEQNTTLSIYDAFVTMIGSTDFNYTCGMHTFGRPDVSLSTDVPIEDAPYLMNGFNQYQLLETTELADGLGFSTSNSEPWLVMSHQDFGYDPEDMLNNPFGRWHLEVSCETPKNETKYQESDEPLFMALRSDDPELMASVEAARASLNWFIGHFASPFTYGMHLVKIRIVDGEESAYFWTILQDILGDRLLVQLFEVPAAFKNYERNQDLLVSPADIYDWSINRNSTVIGGYSRRLQRAHVPPEDRQAFDLFSGGIAYLPLDEIS